RFVAQSNTENHRSRHIKYVFVNIWFKDIHILAVNIRKIIAVTLVRIMQSSCLLRQPLLGLSQNKKIQHPSEEKKRWIIASAWKRTKVFRLASAACWAWP